MNPLKVLFVSSEVAPFIKVGGLADVVGALPRTLVKQGCDARVILPLYKKIKQNQAAHLHLLGWRMVKMGWRSLYAGLYSMVQDGVTYYFVDNEYYFNYDQVYLEYSFDIERYCFFQRAVLDFLGDFIDFEPDILHCNDWQTGMMPLLLEAHYKSFGIHTDIKTVFTIHNLKYQGIHGLATIKDLLDLPDRYLTEELSLKDGAVNFMKAGIVYSNSVTTVSQTYAYEIMTDYYGEGLNATLQRYAFKVSGILNGIDDMEYNPAKDKLIPVTFSYPDYASGKARCKAAVQLQLGLSVNRGAPLCVMISRLVDQKGLDLLLRVLDEMLFDGMQVVILGTGDAYYENALTAIAKKSPEKMCACISFDNGLAHTLYAGADIYLMPSIFEPCGLSQMIAMSYGTIPIARETGGLKDTVMPYNEYTGEGNGFTFANINAHEFLFVTKYACDLYRHYKSIWAGLVKNAMQGDYSWDRSAKEYAGLYSLITGVSFDEAAVQQPNKDRMTDKKATLPEVPSLPVNEKTIVQASEAAPLKETVPVKAAAPVKKAPPVKRTVPVKKSAPDKKTAANEAASAKSSTIASPKAKDDKKAK